MDRVFNMGIGLVIVVAEYFAEAIVRRLSHRLGVPSWIIGEVVAGEKTVTLAIVRRPAARTLVSVARNWRSG